MYVYLNSEPGLWTVGHYAPDGQWHPESDHDTTDAAAARCHYLNGGRVEASEITAGGAFSPSEEAAMHRAVRA